MMASLCNYLRRPDTVLLQQKNMHDLLSNDYLLSNHNYYLRGPATKIDDWLNVVALQKVQSSFSSDFGMLAWIFLIYYPAVNR